MPRKNSIKDPLLGRAYLCCSGTRRNETVTVIGRIEPDLENSELRYNLESERGGPWTISAEKLNRIFGPSTKRACNCHPLDRGEALEEAVEAKVTSPHVEAVPPTQDATPEEVPGDAPPQEPEANSIESTEPEIIDAAQASTPAAISQVIYEEQSPQGLLF